MKRLIVIFSVIFSVISLVAVSEVLTLRFVGKSANDSRYVKLDSVAIENLSKRWRQVIAYPDTVFELQLDQMAAPGRFRLTDFAPNPFHGVAHFNLSIPQDGNVRLAVTDMYGHAIVEINEFFSAGTYIYRVTLQVAETYVITASNGRRTSVLKVINLGGANENSLVQIANSGDVELVTKVAANKENAFALGDEMAYEGYATNGESVILSEQIVKNQQQSETFELLFDVCNPVEYEFMAEACVAYLWNGIEFDQSGDFEQTFKTANGCDSIVTLHLTILEPARSDVYEYQCGSFVWNDQTYTESGNYEQTFTAKNGCDSIVTLHLTVNQPVELAIDPESKQTQQICKGAAIENVKLNVANSSGLNFSPALATLGLTYNAETQTLSGTPNFLGTQTIEIEAVTPYETCDNATISIEITTNELTIDNLTDLQNFRDAVNDYQHGNYKGVSNGGNGFSGVTFRLTDDIDLSSICHGGENEVSWTPIGISFSITFQGNFKGGGHTISNLYIDAPNSNYQGLFGDIYNATIDSLNVVNTNIKGNEYVGGVCGEAYYSTISYCLNSGHVNGIGGYVGGVCGLSNNSTISNCLNSGTVNGTSDNVGGVCGYTESSTISNCLNSGYVNGTNYVGGVCGIIRVNSTISNCIHNGYVSGAGHVGGVCGFAYFNSTISNCLNSGQVSGIYYVGGVCGYARQSTISNCLHTGHASGTSEYIGGVCGYKNSSTITNCYYDNQMCPLENAVGNRSDTENCVGKATAELIGSQIFADNENWVFAENMYPRPAGVAEKEAAIVAATPIFLRNNEKTDNVRTNFTVGKENGVTWTSKQGKITFPENSNEVYIIASGVDTLVCELENARKEIILNLTCEPTIDNLTDLQNFRDAVNDYQNGEYKGIKNIDGFLGVTFRLTDDIDLSSICHGGENEVSWTPIGTNSSTAFQGNFEGGGHTISNLFIDAESSNNQGLFGYIINASIDSLILINTNIKGAENIGGLCGYARNQSTISNCLNSGTVSGAGYVGGVCGEAYSSTISNCLNSGTVSGTGKYVGGVCGYALSSTISNCLNSGTVNGTDNGVGGVCGFAYINSTISNCLHSGYVSGTGNEVGGVCGIAYVNSTITNCYYDNQMCPLENAVGNRSDTENCTGKATAELIGSQIFVGNENWVLAENMYPRPAGVAEKEAAIVAATPLILKNNEKVNNVRTNFTVGKENNVTWTSKQNKVHFVENSNEAQIIASGVDTLVCELENSRKEIILNLTCEPTIDNLTDLQNFRDAVNDYQNGNYKGVSNGGNGFSGVTFRLTDDIDLSSVCNVAEGTIWTPIGGEDNAFQGTFQGGGHTISNLYINAESSDNQGLFGYIKNATIDSLNVANTHVTGNYYVGGVCGHAFNNSTISNCFHSGYVSGMNSVGGVYGEAIGNSTIFNCFNSGTVNGMDDVGGVCGNIVFSCNISNCLNSGHVIGSGDFVGGVCGEAFGNSTISNCLNTGHVSGTKRYVGGVCGQAQYSNLTNCYYDNQMCPLADNGYGTGKSTSELIGSQIFADNENWTKTEGLYPVPTVFANKEAGKVAAAPVFLKNNEKVNNVRTNFTISKENGVIWTSIQNKVRFAENSNEVYIIASGVDTLVCELENSRKEIILNLTCEPTIDNLTDLQAFRNAVNDYQHGNYKGVPNGGNGFSGVTFRLTDDIDLSSVCHADGDSWVPIGEAILEGESYTFHYFQGTFKGGGHTISKLYIDAESSDCQGLFGCINNATIDSLSLVNTHIKGNNRVGGVCGDAFNNSNISNCLNSGIVSGTGNDVGGVCGYIRTFSTISNCINSGNVEGVTYVGGVCGEARQSTISNCLHSGTVSGTGNMVGGVCGAAYNSNISNCLHSGYVNGTVYVGGVCGEARQSTISNCLNGGHVNGANYVGGVCGTAYSNSNISNCYYDNQMCPLENAVGNRSDTENCVGKSTAELIGSQIFVGNENWVFAENMYPRPAGVADKEAAIVAATHIFLRNNENVDNVRTNFTVGKENGVTWTSKQNKVHFVENSNEVYIIASGVDTLVCELENARKEIILNLTCEPTIDNLTDLQAFRDAVNDYQHGNYKGVSNGGNGFLGCTFHLTADIEMNSQESWTPIGGHESGENSFPFQGTFKGRGYTISNLYINSTNDYQGLFGYIKNATIDGLNLANTNIKGDSRVGGVCGYADNASISNCLNSGTVNGTNNVGGVCGEADNISTISNCLHSGTVSGNNHIGGVCGYVWVRSNISNCLHSGTVSGTNGVVGGVCGEACRNATISNCLNSGHVSGTNNIGGVCGYAWDQSNISNCLHSGTVSGNNHIGGVCGYVWVRSNISNCLHSGTVSGTNGVVGGVCGAASGSSITNCLHSGTVSGTDTVGGVCGYQESNSTFTNCYYDNQMCTVGGIDSTDVANQATGKATAELTAADFNGFDSEHWTIAAGLYPRPAGVADHDAAIVAATPIILATGETVDAVQSAFSVGIENEVQWTSTTGLVSIDNNGECTFHQSGADTLVCRLGGVSKRVAIILAGDLTINNLEELQLFRNAVNNYQNGEYKGVPNGGNGFLNRSFRLTANIDLSSVCNETQGSWVPIGEAILEGERYTLHFFQGTFKGGGHTISNLYIDAENSNYQGLFGCINNATIDSLNLVNTNIKGRSNVGGVCGYAYYNSTISNCIHNGHVSGAGHVGGVCGFAYFNSTISDCLHNGHVSGAGHVGGVCGNIENQSTISNCLNSGHVNGEDYIGGVCGYAISSTISNCLNSGHVSGADNVGGVCGDATEYSTISNCLNSGHVSGAVNVGGVCGDANSSNISNCLNSGIVDGAGNNVGGVCGYASGISNISNCLNTGHVNGTDNYVGGVCGYKGSGTITNCYYDNQMCSLAQGIGIGTGEATGKSTAELTGSQIFVDNENWVFAENMYPRPAGVAEKEAAIVAATPVLLANSETADAVHSTFHVSIANEVEWLSKQGNVHIAEDGTCTILGGGLDTLVCMLGNARKEVPIVIISNTLTINNLTDLQNFRDAVNDYQNGVYKGIPNGGNGFRNRTFRLTSNIDLSSVCHGGENEVSWIPIGGYVSEENNFPFQGTFKGGGHTISNLYINAESSNYQGLFGCIENAAIDSLNVANTNIKGGYRVGGVCGYAVISTISNCIHNGNVNGTGNQVGGVCGYAFNNSTISDCLNSGTVSGTGNWVGGVCGAAERSTISECLHSGHVSGLERVGGVCGDAATSNISNCLNSGHVNGTGDLVGGVCGFASNRSNFSNCLNSGNVSGTDNKVGGVCGEVSYNSTISDCLNNGTVSGIDRVGGVCGVAYNNNISNCLNSGHVSGNKNVGGVCGYANSSTISNCLNSGHVSGEDYVGGVCGENYLFSSDITNCYYDNQMCPLADNGYGTGKSTSELIGFTTVFAGNANWNKQVGYYPCPKGLENSDAAKVARTPLLLLASDNVNTVHQGFQATDVNLWSSKLNKVDFSFEFPHIKDGGVDTLVCTYGNAVKEIPVVLYGPMHIENLDDLKAFRDAVNSNGSYKNLPSNGGFVGIDFYLDTDIDLNNENWTPIGTSTTNLNFKGNFHGQEHTISKLYIDASNNNYQGLFGYINNATVENLNVTNSYIVGKNYVGGICGRAYGNSGIYNCTHSGIIVGTDYVGGICGYARELQWCLNSGIVRGSNYVGGVTGAKDSVGKFSDCINVACVSGTSNSVGGVCGGNNSTGTFTNCYYDTRMCSLSRAGGTNANNTDTRKGFATADLTNPNFDFALDENWTRTENMYPRPTEIATTDAAIVGATPVFLANGENFSAVRNDFTVGIGNGVTWSSKQGKVTFDNQTGSATLDASGADTLVCTLGNAKKMVPITIYAPLFIDNSTDLSKFGYAVNNNGEYKGVANNGSGFAGYIIKLRNDISSGEDIIPIGTQARPFKGTFDGNGHTIRDLRLGANGNYKGLFGYIQNATVANVNLESLYISGNQYVGGICGYMEHSTIENCHVYNGEIEGIQGSSNVGGICGYSETTAHSESNHSSIINCTNSCTVTGEEYLGGICGTAAKRTLISGCKNRGIVDGHDDIGGICGTTTTYSTILGCANSGKISGNNRVGGVSGTADYAKINQNVNIGTVNGTADMTGGIVGKLRGDNVENSMNSGLVSGSNQVGGICGYLESSSSLKNCLNVSNTIGTSNIGSICGHNGRSSETTFANCYYDNQMYPLAQGIGSGVGTVYGIMTTGLIGSQIFADNENWTKTEELYPVPTALADSDEAKVAATPAFLANNEKVNNVRTNFTVGKENGVTWSSKQGKITFPENSNEAQIIASGVYTLVCELGDASKAVILNLTCERTIDNLTDLQNFRDAVNDYANGEYKGVSNGGNGFQGITFRLTADIEMNSQESWTPIGGYESVENSFPFQGTFKGGGYTISNLYINAESSDYQGLFGCINNATIDSLSLVNTHIKGNNRVGGVCGDAFNNSNISNCLNSGIVSGTGNVGGVCGCNDTFSSISNCLNNGHVNGTGNNIGGVCGYTVASIISNCLNSGHVIGTNSYVGGVCGDATYSTISNCLNSGTVNGTNDVGGVCGIAYYNSTISNCYYDNQMCPLAKAVGNDNNSGSGNSTAELIGSQIFVGNENWVFAENMYPRPAGVADKEAAIVAATPIFLKNNEKVNNVRTNFTVSTENGVTWTSKNHLVTIDNATGECTFTYGGLDTLVCELGNAMKEIPLVLYGILTINNLEELQLFRNAVNDYENGNYKGISNGGNGFLNRSFRLTANIDLSSVCHGGENEVSWVPIGGFVSEENNFPFQGTFKGGGHTISNLFINSESACQGLFGAIENATIDGLILANTNVKGYNRVGGVCGEATYSTISNCLHSGVVDGTGNDVGGVCGEAYNNSTISNCLNSGHVSGTGNDVGGVCGDAANSNISNCLNSGTVSGTGNHVGGVCGYTIASTISNCLNTGHVSENGRVGSICGYKEGGTITNCYYDNQMCPLAQGIGFGTGEATGKATAELTAADFNGFDSEHWTIAAGLYPRPAGVADHDAAIVAATPIILATGETVDAVQSTFSVGVENEVQWTSTTGLVSINNATGECTFSEGGIDTLVCRLGGVSKQVAIILAGDLTINNLEELQLFRDAVNDYENGNYKGVSNGNNGFLNRSFRLTANIDLSSVCHGGENEVSWTPIGGYGYDFKGTFKGGGYTISNLYINAESSDYQGLFGSIENATIDSLILANTNIKGRSDVGSVCGFANSSTISNCLNSGQISGIYYIGGVCGDTDNSNITNCLHSGHVSGTGDFVGGVCGLAYNNSTISNCLNSGHVSGNNYVGGVCGNNFENLSSITNCYYDNQMCPLAQGIGIGTGEATGKATAELTAADFNGFNSEHWTIAAGLYPRPAGVANEEAAIVAATPVLLASGETADAVYSTFHVGMGNGVTWTSKNHLVTIDNNGECTFHQSGADTLVCTLGNATKEVLLTYDSYGLVIAGTPVTSANAHNITGEGITSGNVTYSPTDSTLTLTNAAIETTTSEGIMSYIDGLKVVLVGNNSITITNSETKNGIASGRRASNTITEIPASMHISGEGSLTVRTSGNFAIDARGNLTIENATIDASSTKTDLGRGVDVAGNLTLTNAYFTTDVTRSGIFARGAIVIDHSVVNARGSRWAICGNNNQSTLTIIHSTVTASAELTGTIADFGSITLNGCRIAEPEGATIGTSGSYKSVVTSNGEKAKGEVKIVVDSPLLIENKEDLIAFRKAVNNYASGNYKGVPNGGNGFLNRSFRLTDNIDLSSVCHGGENEVSWTPIGGYGYDFKGTFKGGGHTISNLYIDAESSNYQGLFGRIGNARIDSLSLVNTHVKGNQLVAGVCGRADNSTISNCLNSGHMKGTLGWVAGVCGRAENSTISNCLNSGHVSGTNRTVGGVCGEATYSTISNCLNSGTVNGTGNRVGGVCGYTIASTISNCLNTGHVNGTGNYVGGVCGYNDFEYSSTITNCYYDNQMCPLAYAVDGTANTENCTGKSTAELTAADFNGFDSEHWTIAAGLYPRPAGVADHDAAIVAATPVLLASGETTSNVRTNFTIGKENNVTWTSKQGKITFQANSNEAQIIASGVDTLVCELGNARKAVILNLTCERTIDNLTDLKNFRDAVNDYENGEYKGVPNGGNGFRNRSFRLTANIDLSSVCNETVGNWVPIGEAILEGENYTLHSFQGTFKGDGHTISNLYIDAESSNYQGLFGDIKNATIDSLNVANTNIKGNNYVGGVCGFAVASNISNCLNSGHVSGTGNSVGGVCGYADNASISNCLNSGTVSGTIYVGGVCGYVSSSTISNCLNSGIVNGAGNNVGGVCGFKESGTITNCYYDNQMCSLAQGIGIGTGEATGKATAELTQNFAALGEAWTAGDGIYPLPTAIADHDAAIVAATPLFLATGETVDAVQSAFSVGVENEVQWTSTTGLVSINDATGECTFSEGGIDTLVCRLGGVSKQVAIILAGDLTINNVEELQLFRDAVNDYQNGNYKGVSNGNNGFRNRSFRLTDNIDLSSVCHGGENEVSWTPIGGSGHTFQGTFKGGGHTISNLYINAESSNYQGLFGCIENATIDSLNVANTNIKGGYRVGGVCGYAVISTISNCIHNGNVNGTGNQVGGVCGYAFNNSTISDCLNSGHVSGTGNVGSVCGFANSSTISNCLNSGHVSGTGNRVGGVCGNNFENLSSITNCYYDNQMCPLAYAVDGTANTENCTGKSTAELTAADFNGLNSEHWTIAAGLYPRPAGVADHDAAIVAATPIILATGETADAVYSTFHVGMGNGVTWTSKNHLVTIDNNGECTFTYGGLDTLVCELGNAMKEIPLVLYGILTINNLEELQLFRNAVNDYENGNYKGISNGGNGFLNRSFRLTANIDLSSVCNETVGSWVPIGEAILEGENYTLHSFQGTFKGGGHTISNLYINAESSNYQGLFGYIKNATIDGLNLANTNIKGDSRVGGVCGIAESSTFSNCFHSGSLKGGYSIGGVCGEAYNNSTISNCLHSGHVSGEDNVGGVCGSVSNSAMSNCLNSGTVNGTNYVGGVCGYASGISNISNCLHSGTVSGTNYVGGVCGYASGISNISNCLHSGTVSGTGNRVGGVCGNNFENLSSITNCYYDNQMCPLAQGIGIGTGEATGKATAELTAADFNGLNSEHWTIAAGLYPRPAGVADHDAAIVAATPIILATGETVDAVQSAFSVGVENEVQWTSTTGLVSINDATGECTFSEGGTDTLVCKLGNAIKEVPIKLFVP